ncbi:MAG: phage tail protein [Caldilineaceae bacterium]
MTESTQSRYVQYLPAIFQERPAADQEPYLGQFLRPFEQVLTTFDDLLAVIDQNFAFALAPDEFVSWLAGWIALALDEEWEDEQRRRLLSEAMDLYRWRGTARGLKRYLEIYTGLSPESIDIRAGRRPAGMQIGVASRIGRRVPAQQEAAPLARAVRQEPVTYEDYYVIDTVAGPDHPYVPAGDPLSLYCATRRVRQVMVDKETVGLWLQGEAAPRQYQPATVRRRNALVDDWYTLTLATQPETAATYRGDSFLIEEADQPYWFMVNVHGPSAAVARTALLALLQQPAEEDIYVYLAPLCEQLSMVSNPELPPVLREQLQKGAARLTMLRARLTRLATAALFKQVRDQVQHFNQQLATLHDVVAQILHAPADLPSRLPQLQLALQAGNLQTRLLALAQTPLTEMERFTINGPSSNGQSSQLPLAAIESALAKERRRAQTKLQAILNLEKPAHTAYVVRFSPEVSKARIQWMQVGVRANIGMDTTIA